MYIGFKICGAILAILALIAIAIKAYGVAEFELAVPDQILPTYNRFKYYIFTLDLIILIVYLSLRMIRKRSTKQLEQKIQNANKV